MYWSYFKIVIFYTKAVILYATHIIMPRFIHRDRPRQKLEHIILFTNYFSERAILRICHSK